MTALLRDVEQKQVDLKNQLADTEGRAANAISEEEADERSGRINSLEADLQDTEEALQAVRNELLIAQTGLEQIRELSNRTVEGL